jgi:hypothetical protein
MCESCKQFLTLCNTCYPHCNHLYSIDSDINGKLFFKKDIMRITLKEPDLELEVYKVDTPTGAGWCVIMPDDRKILIKCHQGKWDTADIVSNQFVQAVGDEIIQFLQAERPKNNKNSDTDLDLKPKRARIHKYQLL